MTATRVVLAAVAVFVLAPAAASACACCADTGYWSTTTRRVTASDLGELDRIRFAASATTFVTAAGLDGVRGIALPSVRYRLAQTRDGRRWTLLLRTPAGRRGTLSFVLPGSTQIFAADLRNGARAAGGGPRLYKEWRLGGAVTGTGDFLPQPRPAKYRLILHGHGNACLAARDFTHWTLVVTGPAARFSLFGALRS